MKKEEESSISGKDYNGRRFGTALLSYCTRFRFFRYNGIISNVNCFSFSSRNEEKTGKSSVSEHKTTEAINNI